MSLSRQKLIKDCSTNGTFVNDEKISERILQNGDKIRIGDTTVLKFSFQDALDKDYHQKLYEMSTKDSLTGTYNKHYLEETLATEFPYHARHGISLSLIVLDIDMFKTINDSFGHLTGDYVLRELATVLKSVKRKEDILARYGGDEFVVLCKNCHGKGALRFCERLQSALTLKDFFSGTTKIPVTISIGFATYSEGNFAGPKEIFKAADKWLYESKNRGRNTISYDKNKL